MIHSQYLYPMILGICFKIILEGKALQMKQECSWANKCWNCWWISLSILCNFCVYFIEYIYVIVFFFCCIFFTIKSFKNLSPKLRISHKVVSNRGHSTLGSESYKPVLHPTDVFIVSSIQKVSFGRQVSLLPQRLPSSILLHASGTNFSWQALCKLILSLETLMFTQVPLSSDNHLQIPHWESRK